MTAPTTPLEVVRQLSVLNEQLRQHVRAYTEAEQDAAMKRHAADMAESRAFLAAEGAMDLRKHHARTAASDAEEAALVAEAVVRSLRQKMRAIEIDIESHRTYGTTIRAELKTLGMDGAA